MRLLTENNREVSLSEGRVVHVSSQGLNISDNRDLLVKNLKECSKTRKELTSKVNIKELWELLHEEGEEIDIPTMTMFCFDPPLTPDHEASVIRAFFDDRMFFKFNRDRVSPHSPDQIEAKQRQIREAEEKERLLDQGASWIKQILACTSGSIPEADPGIVDILKDYYVFDRESSTAAMAKTIVSRSGLESLDQIFSVLVKAGIWSRDENIDLIRMGIPTTFPVDVLDHARAIIAKGESFTKDPLRRDLTHLPIITIDGQSTLDYDDALSLEKTDNGYTLGIHIIDVCHYIDHGSLIEREARNRGSSIYMPDDKIPMLPPNLSEDLCSLKEGELRPGISTMVRLNRFFELIDYEIIPSIIRVHKQMTYTEANLLNGENDPITTLHKAATVLREKRLKAGAIQISLPEVNLWIEDNGDIGISRIDRENSSRMLVSELMILANTLMAEFLATNKIPAVFRSQAEPKKRLFQGLEPSLFLNCMQRKHLSRAIISSKPDAHSGLGVKAYVTATSPIRRYHDLITQRQIRGLLGYEKPCSRTALDSLLQALEIPVGNTGRIQYQRRKYWLFKHLETLRGSSLEGIVLEVRRDFHTILLKEFMLEWKIPAGGVKVKPGDLISVTIQHADARRDVLSLFV
ncbi:MAG: RNB domain-containing ribonuclease [Pseudomonadota bacterium]